MKPLLTLLLLSILTCARAQQLPADTALAARVERIETRTSGWDKLLSHLPKISGYVQTGFEWSEHSSDFFLKRVRLNLAGDIGRRVGYRVQVEFCSPKIVDAYVEYRPLDAVNARVGQYKIPFSIENTDYAPLKLEVIEYPLVLRKLMGFNDLCGLAATGRDLGAMLWGGFFRRADRLILSYDLGVFNGEGINTRDRNKSKDLSARLTLRPLPGLQLSGSGYWGEYGTEYMRRTRYGAGAAYDRGPVSVRGEYICGTTGQLESAGWYLLAGWRATPSLMPVVRCDTFTADCDRPSATRQNNYTAGLSWQPLKYLRCQLDYTFESCAGAPDRNGVAVMVSGIF